MQRNRDGVQKLFRLFGLFNLLFLVTALFGAGDFEDFKQTQAQAFTKFLDEKDNLFDTYLKSEWQEYKSQMPLKFYKSPKPRKIFPTTQKNIKSVGPTVSIQIDTKNNTPLKIKKDIIKHDIDFDFFGTKLGFNIAQKIQNALFYPKNQQGISNFFEVLASSDYQYLIKNIKNVCHAMELNDWATYLLVNTISNKIFKDDDSVKLFNWFIFNKLGYGVKAGIAKKHVIVMYYTKNKLYATPSYTFKGKKYYVLSNYNKGALGNLYSYEQNYEGAEKAFDFSLKKLPLFEMQKKTKKLQFEEEGVVYKFPIVYNKNMIDFMATYPQVDYEIFFNTPMENETSISLLQSFKKYLDTKHSSDAINFVLHFVQKSFGYQVDQEQFKREKVMFAEETLFYDKSDCEDRAILFAYLSKKMFGISVVGVKYKNHMATALYIPMNGDSVKIYNKRYVIADPTYVNASIGQSMPQYRSLKPESYIKVF